MGRLMIGWLVNAMAIYAAFQMVPGIHAASQGFAALLFVAFVFGLVNALIKPVVKLFTCPFLILTLGLGILIVNAFMFWLAGYAASAFGVGYHVDGFKPAFFGALVVSAVSFVLNLVLGSPEDDDAED